MSPLVVLCLIWWPLHAWYYATLEMRLIQIEMLWKYKDTLNFEDLDMKKECKIAH